MNGWPKTVNVMGINYSVTYCRDMVEADIGKSQAVWGQVEYQTRTIRIFVGKGERKVQPADVHRNLVHEMIHAVVEGNQLIADCLKEGSVNEPFTDQLATVLSDTLVRNGMTVIPLNLPVVACPAAE